MNDPAVNHKKCEFCDGYFGRRVRTNGEPEWAAHFARRRYCSVECRNKANSARNPSTEYKKGVFRWDSPNPEIRDGYVVHRGEYWIVGCPIWDPRGIRGQKLIRRLEQEIKNQVDWVLKQPELMRQIREGGDVETLLDPLFKGKHKELYLGTVRRIESHWSVKCSS